MGLAIGTFLGVVQRGVGFVIVLSTVLTINAQDSLVDLRGEVKDEFGGLITKATVTLSQADTEKHSVFTDKQGTFRINGLNSGRYLLQVSAKGFAVHRQELELNAVSPAVISITLYPTIEEVIDVGEREDMLAASSETMAGTLVLTEANLQDLPDDPDELAQRLQSLAATSGGVPGGAVVSVDGFFSDGRLPSKSAIREVRINPNIYSAEYDSPPFRGGRIEVSTKPGSGAIAGSAFFNFSGGPLNARNPFAETRPDTMTRRYGFQFGAPIKKDWAGFLIDLEKRDIDEFSTVHAVTLDHDLQPVKFIANVPNPQRLTIGSIRGDWQAGKNHTLGFRYDLYSNKISGLGAGGLDLPERAFDNSQLDHSFRFSETAVINPRAVNEFRAGITFDKADQNAISTEPIIRVAGSFTYGGADLQMSRLNERRLEIQDNLVVDTGKHILKIGTQIFGTRSKDRRQENQNGAFFFGGGEVTGEPISGLEQYRRTLTGSLGGVPSRFTLKVGMPLVSTDQWRLAGFVQDEWKVDRKVLVSLGLRAEAQTVPTDIVRFAPRVSIAYSPDKKQKWVFRARAGIFYERIDDLLTQETERLDGKQQREILIDSPGFPNPFTGGVATDPVLTRRVLNPGLRAPGSLQLRVEMEHQLTKDWKVSTSLSQSFGWDQLVSRNINAPLVSAENPDPETAPRPFGVPENIMQFESSGRLKGRVIYVGVNQNSNKYFTVNAGYLYFNFATNADSAFAFPQSSYDLSSEMATPAWQSDHRAFASLTANLPWKLRLSAFINAFTGTPYNVTTGRDNNGDGIFNDRPGLSTASDLQAVPTRFGFLNPFAVGGDLPRNRGTNPSNMTVDINLSRTFVLKKGKGDDGRDLKLAANVRAGNAFNRTNPRGVSGIMSSPFFGRPYSSYSARRIEFGLRFTF